VLYLLKSAWKLIAIKTNVSAYGKLAVARSFREVTDTPAGFRTVPDEHVLLAVMAKYGLSHVTFPVAR
jgi:hypothetical protein